MTARSDELMFSKLPGFPMLANLSVIDDYLISAN
jgi:hypothetical protein